MISVDLALRLRDAGLGWEPAPGDWFTLPDRGMDEPFVLSSMTVQVYDVPQGTVIGFNGTTESALDNVEKDEAIWMPREDQLRVLLGADFHRLDRVGDGFQVATLRHGERREFVADTAADAYGEALLARLRDGSGLPAPG